MHTNTVSSLIQKRGFTLIEILIVMGLIAILAAAVIVAVNPARQFAQARNSQRVSNINAILNAIGQNLADNKGIFTCGAGILPTTVTPIKKTGGYDMRPCIVPDYITEIPYDPSVGNNTCDAACLGSLTYDTGYQVMRDEVTGRITISAPGAELGQIIAVTR